MSNIAEQNQAKVKELMANAEQVRLGTDLESGVNIDYTSVYGDTYTGLVVFKRPSMKDYMRMGAIKSEYLRLNGVMDINLVDNTVKQMAQVMATLTVVAVKRPEWLLSIETIEDPDLLFHVYDKYEAWESSFRKSYKDTSTGDSGATE